MTNSSPIFKIPLKELIRNYLTNEVYYLRSIDPSYIFTDENIVSFVNICNEKEVYELYKKRLGNKPYTIEDAQRFINWSYKGWIENTHFRFAIQNASNKLVGVMDIQDTDLIEGTIGFWISQNVKGVMTNALLKLCEVAKSAGYKSLNAYTNPKNIKAIKVLQRAGFVYKAEIEEKNLLKYEKTL
jgi:RimJ/RimL family protein N-acetyltransferase